LVRDRLAHLSLQQGISEALQLAAQASAAGVQDVGNGLLLAESRLHDN